MEHKHSNHIRIPFNEITSTIRVHALSKKLITYTTERTEYFDQPVIPVAGINTGLVDSIIMTKPIVYLTCNDLYMRCLC